MRPAVRKSVYAGIAGLSLAGTVAGCAPSTGGSPAAGGSTPAAAASGSNAAASSPAAGASTLAAGRAEYKDGTYSADGTYVSPNGTETVGVQLTLAKGTVTDVKITPHPSSPNTRKFQGEFAGGIAAQVVGRNIDELNVSKVAGSSLTSGGFNKALEQIKAEAR